MLSDVVFISNSTVSNSVKNQYLVKTVISYSKFPINLISPIMISLSENLAVK